MTHDERDVLSNGLSVFLDAITRLEQTSNERYATKADVQEIKALVEETRRVSAGARDWTKIGTAVIPLLGVMLTAVLKAHGWL